MESPVAGVDTSAGELSVAWPLPYIQIWIERRSVSCKRFVGGTRVQSLQRPPRES
jgi:hypothetical protein